MIHRTLSEAVVAVLYREYNTAADQSELRNGTNRFIMRVRATVRYKAVLLSVYLSVVLLLSVFTVRGSACDDLVGGRVSNLQVSIKHEERTGFATVFPKNYYVQHYFNESRPCEEQCCVFSAAFLLADSWKQLLQNIELVHVKHGLIKELILTLDSIWEGSFQETRSPLPFPVVRSTPRALLTFTSDVFGKWLALNCPAVKVGCAFPSPASLVTSQIKDQENEQSVSDGGRAVKKEGEREKRWITVTPKNGAIKLSATLSFLFCILCCLKTLLDVMPKELG